MSKSLPRPPVFIRPFSKGHFFSLLANDFLTEEYIRANEKELRQAFYLAEYLDRIGAKTIVCENEYIDGDYLEDYATFYVSCYEQFGNRCKRLHFFKQDFTADFEQRIARTTDKTDDDLQKAYLGFVVVRPLPRSVIGRTEIVTYETTTSTDRQFPATKIYHPNVFGQSLTVKSLAYQQQDSVLAACATVTLWTAFHKTADLFGTPVPRPAAITRTANTLLLAGRAVPSKGLRLEQMCEAIRRVGLDPVVEMVRGNMPLLSILHGYLEYGLPVILGGGVKEADYYGHAVTVVGYALSRTVPSVSEPQVGLTVSKGRRIEKLYVHDDGVGPFAKMVPQALPSEAKDWKIKPPFMLESRDPADIARYTLQPWFVLVPAYGKMRITYSEASTWAWKFCEVLSTLDLGDRIVEWRIYLTDTQKLKSEVRTWTSYSDKLRILETSQPRFIWRMQAVKDEDCLVELLLDATGVVRSCQLFDIIWHDDVFKTDFETKLALLPKSDFEQEYPKRFADLCYRK